MELRSQAEQIVLATLAAVAPETLIPRHFSRYGDQLMIKDTEILIRQRPIICLGAGKAASRMAQTLSHVLGQPFDDGVLATPDGHVGGAPGCLSYAAGHPLPDERSMVAAAAAMDRAQHWAERNPLVLGVLSGGASALWCLPRPGLTLEQKREAGQWLLASGLPIDKMNTIRRRLSAIKGGRLAAAMRGAEIHVFVLSDVPEGQRLDVVGSGPFHPDPTDIEQALAALREAQIPPPSWLERAVAEAPPKPEPAAFARVRHHQVGSNRDAMVAAARKVSQLGFQPAFYDQPLVGEAADVGRQLAELARLVTHERPIALVFGGETTVTLSTTAGRGGRNQEMALAFSLALEGREGLSLLAFSTDGIDGQSNAAGAFVDGRTARRIRDRGLDPAGHLAGHDSYHALAAADALILTGPTSTNVADVALVFAV
jgi:hydroxypyruvate reductase